MKRSSKFMKRLLSVVLLVSFFSFVPTETNSTKAAYTREVSNNRPYKWYMDQGDTGKFAGINCGPTSTAMILKMVEQNSSVTENF